MNRYFLLVVPVFFLLISCGASAPEKSQLLGISGDRAVMKRGGNLAIVDISTTNGRVLGTVSNWTAFVLGAKAHALFLADQSSNIHRMDLTTGERKQIDKLFAPVTSLFMDSGEGALYVLAGNAMLIYHLSNGVIQLAGYPEPAEKLVIDGLGKTYGLLSSNRLRLAAVSNFQEIRVVTLPEAR